MSGGGGDANQQWKITKNSDGTNLIKPMDNTSLAMEVYCGVDAHEQPVTNYTYSNLAQFKWRIIQNGDGTVRIMPAISNSRALDVYGGVTKTSTFNGRSFPKRDGIDCQIVDYNGNSHQKWVLCSTVGNASIYCRDDDTMRWIGTFETQGFTKIVPMAKYTMYTMDINCSINFSNNTQTYQ